MRIPFFGCSREAQHNLHWMGMVDRILRSGRYLQGPYTEALEHTFSQLYPGREAVAVGSCTDALFYVLKSILAPGESVLIPDISFVATASSVVRAGGRPIFVDVDPDTLLMDMNDAEQKVEGDTAAFVLVHLFGNVAYDYQGIDRLKDLGLYCIEDCAQAFGSYVGSIRAGTIGDAACFSFDPTKPIGGPGSGGMIIDSPAWADDLRRMRYHDKPAYTEIGYNSQISEICAAIVLDKIERKSWNVRAQVDMYRAGLVNIPEIRLQDAVRGSAYSKFAIQVPDRENLIRFLSAKGIETRIHYPYSLHSLPAYRRYTNQTSWNSCAVCEDILSLPIHQLLGGDEISYIVDCIKEYFDGHS